MTLFDRPILAIESSCDETSAAVVHHRSVLSNIVASQIDMHRKWGGVVPEAAARAHVEAILPVISEALTTANLNQSQIGAIAVTNRPGLVGALSVGATAAKAMAYSLGIPLIGIHHLEGHILSTQSLADPPGFPHVCLVVSGGPTELVEVTEPGLYTIIGQTRDDAAGEAFDKGSRLLGLGYPGGLAIQNAAKTGNPKRYALPKGLSGDTVDFSFSGLKTAVLRLTEKEGSNINVSDAAASLQEVIVAVLTERAMRAMERLGNSTLTLVGGVAANLALRERMEQACLRNNYRFASPPIDLCTDNAAMIGIAASFRLAKGECSGWDLDVFPNADL